MAGMAEDELKQAVKLIKAGRIPEARSILEPIIVADPHNIQAWVWEIETRENDFEKIKLMEACLLHNPDSSMIKKALTALKNQKKSIPVKSVVAPFVQNDSDLLIENEKPISRAKVAETPVSSRACPSCGGLVANGQNYCGSCGRNLTSPESTVEGEKPETKSHRKWFHRSWVKVLLFFFLLPVWCVVELGDSEAAKGFRVLAGIILVFLINIISLAFYWLFTTNSSRANLLNWYQYLTGESRTVIPGGIVRVDGNVQNPGGTLFSLVELQARVYDDEGNLLGNSTRYLDSSALIPGAPARFQMDVTSLLSPLNVGITNQQILFYDDFTDRAKGWTVNKGETGESIYYEGRYRITVDAANYDLWSNPGKSYQDVKIEVDASKQAGPENNRFGLQCRYSDVDNYYFAVVSSDGYYGIGKLVDGVQTFLPENGMHVTDKIYAGSAVNHIRFDCVGSRLSLYINGDYVAAVDDSDLTEGDIGLLAGTFEEVGTQVSFDNLMVISP